jgi:hypothetical protein
VGVSSEVTKFATRLLCVVYKALGPNPEDLGYHMMHLSDFLRTFQVRRPSSKNISTVNMMNRSLGLSMWHLGDVLEKYLEVICTARSCRTRECAEWVVRE